MAVRWIALSGNSVSQSVALLSQTGEVPQELSRVVTQCDGVIYKADPDMSVLERALWLRALATEKASVVVLHVDPDDVISYLAFSVPGGPRVMTVNHAAHIFWLGASVADLVVQCRGSDCENEWTARFRGIERFATIPIPLGAEGSSEGDRATMRVLRVSGRRALGIPDGSPAIMTAGDKYKFAPMEGISFHAAVENVLGGSPKAYWIVVGVEDDGSWEAVAKRADGRLLILGRQSRGEMQQWRAVADVYAEGFPFGSTTALLEAGMQGLPVVLAPLQCPPPYGSDGIAIDRVLKRPASIADYVEMVRALLAEGPRREKEGQAFQRAIQEHHTGVGWREYLARATARLPSVHQVKVVDEVEPVPTATAEYWMRFRIGVEGAPERALENVIRWAVERDILPRIGSGLIRAVRTVRDERRGRAAPWIFVWIFCNFVLPVLGAQQRIRALDEFIDLFRPGSRTIRTLLRIVPTELW